MLCIWPKDRLDLGVAAVELAKPVAVPKEVAMTVSNVLPDIFMVILITYNGTQVWKKQIKLF